MHRQSDERAIIRFYFFDYMVYKINRFTNLRQRIMKKLMLSALMAICAMSAAEAQNMKVVVTGIKNTTGKISY